MDEALYDRLIVTRARKPLHAAPLANPDVSGEGKNPLCGDRTRLDIRLDGPHIAQISHHTRGCAICAATADLMAERLAGCSIEQADALSHRFSALLRDGADRPRTQAGLPELGALQALAPVRAHKARIRCAELPWIALKEALSHVRN
ncbi:SUF system NifU family Fe-S cluster assembly protein [Acetobacter sp. TBRC 12305]|uniref:SUF system NifU family Fe-S cluster assembly protein n=1 Tax=Acetobacter garciniae TaxID=2817435 RepID=A0A939KNM7_9PROT|nr:SUF system NifU family Fe-S cluster assembly protein [Acetobacter garciniae]MBO1325870.1 SUF system NifU family Fe-S cluster assembly protein [Acetobacter garciniae]MBX0345770.1 SUF system NifU family Fe-S cluster assembly protein [Acetobacter garciniae]